MFTHQISIKVSDESKLEEAYSAFDFLLHTYHTRGHIWGKHWPMYIQGDTIVAIVKTPEEYSLTTHISEYLQMRIDYLKEHCGNDVEIKLLGLDYAPEPVCTCAQSDYYVLVTDWAAIESPIKCGSCYNVVPLYKTPAYKDEVDSPVQYWDDNFKACETLLMLEDVGGEFSLDETNNVESKLSAQGRKICADIEKKSNTPAYYFLPNNVESTVDRELDSLCPSCGGQWLLTQPAFNGVFNFKCDNCRLVSTFSTNLQG